MKSARFIFPAAICLAVVLFLLFNKKSRIVDRKPAVAEAVTKDEPLATTPAATPTPKPVEVYFLSEADTDKAAAEAPKGMRQPTINGNRRIVNPRPVTTKEEGDFIHPRWSPDSLEVMFSKGGYNGLYTKGVLGGSLTQVTDRDSIGFFADYDKNGKLSAKNPRGEKQTYEPDGTPADSVAVETNDTLVGTYTKDDNVYYRANPGEPAKPITSGNDRYYGGVISPDGQYIVYAGVHTGLYVQPLDGSAPATSLGEGYSPQWLPDGGGLVYNIAQDDGHYLISSDLYLATPDGQVTSNLTNTPDQIEVNPAVSPDGSKVAYEQDGMIYVADLE